jgi:hypothetical protein
MKLEKSLHDMVGELELCISQQPSVSRASGSFPNNYRQILGRLRKNIFKTGMMVKGARPPVGCGF